MLLSAQSQEEYDMWLEKLQANTVDVNAPHDMLKPDLVGDVSSLLFSLSFYLYFFLISDSLPCVLNLFGDIDGLRFWRNQVHAISRWPRMGRNKRWNLRVEY